ncbi:polysaccharide deacetylase family protein [Micromonospora sp. NBC_00421]|uniref:polysaccharide deacetylase family protein n=1 Tax=Micromonospora sp. NBC_00421 TaxID=2975976 RepID=UPI002E1C7BC1
MARSGPETADPGGGRWGRRRLLGGGALLVGGVTLGAAGMSQGTWLADRHLPLSAGPASATVGNRRQDVGSGGLQVVWHVPTTERLVALTFDDGPLPRWTPTVLDILDRHAVPATFFLVGTRVRRHADLIRGRLTRHEVGNHSWRHRDLARLSAPAVHDDLRRSHEAITEVAGVPPRLVRPPYGHLGGGVLHAAVRLDYRVVLWSLQMVEGEFPDDPAGHARRIVADVVPGTILLAHDAGSENRQVALRGLDAMISGLRARGYTFVTVSRLLSRTAVPRAGG